MVQILWRKFSNKYCMHAHSISRIQLFVTLWTAAHQVPLSLGLPRQEYWSELQSPPPGNLPNQGTEASSPSLAGFLPQSHLGVPAVQFSLSVMSSCLRPHGLCTPGLPVHHQRPEFIQTHVRWVNDAIQLSHPLSSPSSPAFNPSQHQGLLQ